jgi:ABC-type amino acid transport substrate-binding protein
MAALTAALTAALAAALPTAVLAVAGAGAQPAPAPALRPAPSPRAVDSAGASSAPPRFAALVDPVLRWLPAVLFNRQDRATAQATPPLRVAVPRSGVPAHVELGADGEVQGPQVQWLLAVAQVLGVAVTPVVVADEAAALQALRDDRADLALALPPPAAPQPGLSYSLGTGAQPLAWVVRRDLRPVALDQARIAYPAGTDPVVADRLRRRYPDATPLPQPDALQALQAVAERRADAYVGGLLPVLSVLRQTALPGLELRQVWPGAAGHRHLVLRDERAALLPAFNKAIVAWRATPGPHQAVLQAAQRAAPLLRAPLALPADLAGADSAVMDHLLKAPYALSADAAERLPLAERSIWRVGVLRAGPMAGSAHGDAATGGMGEARPGATGNAAAGGRGHGPAIVAALSGIDAQGRHTGVAADLMQELALRLGVLVQLQPFDTDAEMLQALRAGRIDVLPLLEHTPERDQGLQYSLPWLELAQVLVGADDGPLYWGLYSLRGRRLALAGSHPLRAELQRLHPGVQLVDAADGAGALALVREGRADAALDIKPVVQQQLASAAGHGLRVLGDEAAFTARYRVALPAAQRSLLPLLDAALADIDADEQQRSLRRWLVQEPVPARPWWHSPWWAGAVATAAACFALLAAWGWARRWPWRQREGRRRGALDDAASTAPTALAQAAPQPARPGGPAAVDTDAAPLAQNAARVHLGELLQSAITPLRRQADDAGQRLAWAVDEVLPARVHIDPGRLAELVELLLRRALLLTAPQGAQGRVLLKVRRASLDNGHPALQLSCNATAPSTPQEAALGPHLQRAHELAVALGGDLMVRNHEGVGHVVSVRVPLRGASRG